MSPSRPRRTVRRALAAALALAVVVTVVLATRSTDDPFAETETAGTFTPAWPQKPPRVLGEPPGTPPAQLAAEPDLGPFRVVVDPTLQPAVADVDPLEGTADRRPVGAL